MNEIIINKLSHILNDVLDKKGELNLFAAIQRKSIMTWDIVISGKNIDKSRETVNELSRIIKKYLDRNEIISFSRLILLKPDNSFIKNINGLFNVSKNATIRLNSTRINDIFIDKAIIFYSKKSTNNN